MEIEEIKQQLHSLIDVTNDESILISLLKTALQEKNLFYTNENDELSEEDYAELLSIVNEPPEKDTISYNELKSSLSRWFTK